ITLKPSCLISCSHWLPDGSLSVLVGRHGAMNPAGRVRCNMWKKVKSRNDYRNIPLLTARVLARIGFGHWRVQLRLGHPGPSVGGLTGGPGSCSAGTSEPRADPRGNATHPRAEPSRNQTRKQNL